MKKEIKKGDRVSWDGGKTNNVEYTATGVVVGFKRVNTGGIRTNSTPCAKIHIDDNGAYPFIQRCFTTISVYKLRKI